MVSPRHFEDVESDESEVSSLRINSRYHYNALWLIGAILLIYYSSFILDFANEWKIKNFNVRGYNLWLPILTSFISGVYLAFIHGVPKQIRINRSRIIVFFISILLLTYFVLSFYFELPEPDVYIRIIKYNGPFFLELICGYSVITGLLRFKDQE